MSPDIVNSFTKGPKMKFTFTIIALLLGANSLLAQDPLIFAEQKREDGTFANMFHFTFKPGKSDEGLELLRSSLIPAFLQSEINVTLIEDLMGTKDVMLIVPLEQGPSYYASTMPVQDQKLWASLNTLLGSPEKAEEQLDKFVGLLEKQSQTLVFLPKLF